MRDEAAQVEYRKIQKVIDYQVQDIDDTAGSAVSVGERVYAFELVMYYRPRFKHETQSGRRI